MIFIDTGFFVALFVEDDPHHKRVKPIFAPYDGRRLDQVFLTTNYVIDETITLLRYRGHPDSSVRHRLALRIGRQLMAGNLGTVYRASVDDEQSALEYFARHDDQRYSFTDCLSFVVMLKHGIQEAFAVDEDFTHRFTATPGPLPKRR